MAVRKSRIIIIDIRNISEAKKRLIDQYLSIVKRQPITVCDHTFIITTDADLEIADLAVPHLPGTSYKKILVTDNRDINHPSIKIAEFFEDLTPKQAAIELAVSVQRIRDFIRQGRFKGIEAGRPRVGSRIPRLLLEEFKTIERKAGRRKGEDYPKRDPHAATISIG